MKQNYFSNQYVDIKNPELIDRKSFEYLAGYQDVYCMTINLPPKFKTKDSIENLTREFKNQLINSNQQLDYQGLNAASFKNLIRNLLDVFQNWNDFHHHKSLVIYCSTTFVKTYYAPIELPFKIYLNNHFYLKAVSQLFNSVTQKLILYISESHSSLFELKNVAYEKRFEIKNNKRIESYPNKYIGLIHNEVTNLKELKDQKQLVSLLVTGKKELVDSFIKKSVNKISNMESIYVSETKAIDEIKEKTISKLGSIIQNQAEIFRLQAKNSEIIDKELDVIIKASNQGEIKNLFIEKDFELFGEYDINNDFVFVGNEEDRLGSLANMAAVKTVLNNGNVFLLPKEEMPIQNCGMNAVVSLIPDIE